MGLILFLASLAVAQPRCPRNGTPSIQPHPFRPLICDTAPDKSVEKDPQFTFKRSESFGYGDVLKPISGRWEGWMTFGFERYEVLVDLWHGWGGYKGWLQAREHRTLRLHKLKGRVVGPMATGTATVRFAQWEVPVGSATIVVAQPPPGYDWALLISVDGKPSQQVAFKRERKGRALKVWWLDVQRPGLGPSETELKASRRRSLEEPR